MSISLCGKIMKVLFITTFIICVPPLILYASARRTGALQSQSEWNKIPGIHGGPWYGEPQGLLVTLLFIAMLALPIVTSLFAVAMGLSVQNQKLVVFVKGVLLVFFQAVFGIATFSIVFWTID